MDFPQKAVTAFWSRVSCGDGCWEYAPGMDISKRRARIQVAGKGVIVSRFSWMLHYGEIPSGLFVCHHCDNGRCVRPDHLFLGTQKDNMRDMFAKGRGRPNKFPTGSAHPSAKLNADKVRAAFEMRRSGQSISAIARHFGVAFSSMWGALNGKAWRHVS